MSDHTDKSSRVVSVLSRPGAEVAVAAGTFGNILVILVFCQRNVTSQVPVAKGTRETVSRVPCTKRQ